jgi:hypothetical protein
MQGPTGGTPFAEAGMRILFFSLGVLVALYAVLGLYVYVRITVNDGWVGWPGSAAILVPFVIEALVSFSLFYAAHRWSKTKSN